MREDSLKPRQIWTQGETKASSAWFPTIDAPNQKMTHDIKITVDKSDVTLSNGVLSYSSDNGDGTRSDYWVMNQPHSVYLVMLAVGEFIVTKDQWRNKEVNYYLEKNYAPYAKAIFGNTPEMMEFFSNKLKVDYPWEKYSQIVVRDYVSGAMENTTATLHGESVQKSDLDIKDSPEDAIIAHELIHHWFGDLVTCESWANLPLNESFATYGEYLWDEYKYGRDAADYGLQSYINEYLLESRQKQADMIRFNYEDKEDMFDSHSYAKGGRILHMLRKYLGDDVFFESLTLYLNRYKFKTTEIHDLRTCFEEVSGMDLNWFFNQWFMASGHPILNIAHKYDSTLKQYTVRVEQAQNFATTPLYKLPFDIDIYTDKGVERKKVVLNEVVQEFVFKQESKPRLVNVDAEKMLLVVKNEEHTKDEWAYMYQKAPLYLDRWEALYNLAKTPASSITKSTLNSAFSDKSPNIRCLSVYLLPNLSEKDLVAFEDPLKKLILNDTSSSVREAALSILLGYFNKSLKFEFFKELVAKEKSNVVLSTLLPGLMLVDSALAMETCAKYETMDQDAIISAVSQVYAQLGNEKKNDYFTWAGKRVGGFYKFGLLQSYIEYLLRMPEPTLLKGVDVIENVARNSHSKWQRITARKGLSKMADTYYQKSQMLSGIAETYRKEKRISEADNSQKESEQAKQIATAINKKILSLKPEEFDFEH